MKVWAYILLGSIFLLSAGCAVWAIILGAGPAPGVPKVAVPDPFITPGMVDQTCDASKACAPGYTQTVRKVEDHIKKAVCLAYGITVGCPGPEYEIDHLISLELCGSNDIKNLWPEPITEAREKDKLENSLHRQVCNNPALLPAAQARLVNWGK